MKIFNLIDQIGNVGNRPDLEQWRTEIIVEAEKLIAVVRAAQSIEATSPTPDNYVGGQCATAQRNYTRRRRLRDALKILEKDWSSL